MTPKNDLEVVQAWQEAVQAEVKTRPWFAALLLQKGNRLFERFVHFYARLTAVGQRQHRRLAVGIGTAALALALSSAPTPAHAATITVGGDCTLVMAIENANDINDGQPNADCAAGDPVGADTIVLAGNTYSYTTAHGTESALPDITSEITIEAHGATIARNATAGDMRIIHINSNGNLTLNNATITGGSGVLYGGGIYNNGGTLTLNNSTISGNESYVAGGGIDNRSNGTTTLNNSTVSGNTAKFNYYIFSLGNGGGIFNNGGTLTLNNSTVSGNESYQSGGGISSFLGATTTLNNSTVSGNTADNSGFGGGIFNGNGATTTLNNSTVSGNTATDVGGGIANSGTTTLNNSTITGNTADNGFRGYGGGITNYGLGTTTLARTIVSGNNASTGAEIRQEGSSTVNVNAYNVLGRSGLTNAQAFDGFTPGTSDINATSSAADIPLTSILNPTLANNGGPTLTHALVSDSPAIDIAPTADCENGVLTSIDQRGAARNVDGDGIISANECDAGAIEHNSLQIPTELRFIGNCEGADLSGNQTLSFTGGMVNLNVTAANGLKCISVGQFTGNHPNATGSPGNPGIATGQWWRINGNIDTGFTVDVTLPFANAGASTRACKWLDGLGAGAGWDCGDDADNDAVPGVSVTRLNYTDGFSDWAVGDEVGPTAVSNLSTQTSPPSQTPYIPLLATLLTLLSGAWLWLTRPQRF